jgi:PAS domain S-box-containing protein
VHTDDRHSADHAGLEHGAITRWTRRDGREVWVEHRSVLVRDSLGDVEAAEGIVRDVTEQVASSAALLESETRFRVLLDALGVGAVMLDTEGCVTFVNQHFLVVTGWPQAALVGADWFHVLVPRDDREGAREVFRRSIDAGAGGDPSTTRVLRRDGTQCQFAMSTTVLHDSNGRATGIAIIGADLTKLHHAELERDRLGDNLREAEVLARSVARQRTELVAALQRMGPLATFEETAQAMCAEMIKLTGVDIAAVGTFEGVDRLCVIGAAGSPVRPGEYIPRYRGTYLWERAARGPWTDVAGDASGPFTLRSGRSRGLAMAISPIVTERGVVGLLFLGTKSRFDAGVAATQLPAATEFAAIARSLIGPGLEGRRDEVQVRAGIERVISSGAFHPVFQPVVDLETMRPIGYEALTRFDSRQRPDRLFAAAHRTGLGLELEFATLAASLREAARLPAGVWLSLNVSPGCVLSGGELARILEATDRPVVLEITEHDRVADYSALREAIEALGPGVRIAVDDAGSGVANFDHLVQLRADFVKIDGSLIRNVNADVTRQALIVGLRHFAQSTGQFIVAEGVETDAELATLRSLDVRYGQGFLLGRPAAARHLQLSKPRRVIQVEQRMFAAAV